jgi:hypothetical protein
VYICKCIFIRLYIYIFIHIHIHTYILISICPYTYIGHISAKGFACPEMSTMSDIYVCTDTGEGTDIPKTDSGGGYICYYDHKSYTGEDMNICIGRNTGVNRDIHANTGVNIHVHQTAPWSYQADYYGVCTCIHQMLYLQPLSTMTGTYSYYVY